MTQYINMTAKDPNEKGIDKRLINTVEELKKLNSNKDLNEKNVIALMSEFVPLITKSSNVNYQYNGPIAFGIYTFPALCTLLHIAARFNYDKIADHLIKAGADVNSRDMMLCTPLHYAAIYGNNVEVAKVLIDKKADVNAKGSNERTPLHYAAQYSDDIEVAKVLIANGGDLNARDKDEKTPLQHALEKDHLKVAELLISKGANQLCVPAYINKKSQEKGTAPAFIVAGISAIVIQQVLFHNTELSKYAIIGASIASMILAGGVAYGIAYMWSKYELSSKLKEVKHDNSHSLQPTK
ncbi:ankyrin repeat domain-containing protein [Wolbachia endosymbiont of Pentalonia nigronervosa]|uniref:ankyrin repeat domain-containing protein n=1 Tax=Wolbachia endosymbiont of Pentalonia nigronervosa TaxID=1301914 RepID=UPI00165FB963|nr:ankyrin repeat domain-containing protein [Wolbachia endosymbiont of Pentalonia nigronervosa]MBD0391452.1 ankyrin repeat domain-containing protein [Wolbachia endosymbiont of Pentalonia nigronervosa]